MSAPTKSYNILFLGETQSGKSTLIEFLRKYADPGYTIQKNKLGDVITVANNPFTEGLTNALKAYIDLLPDGRDTVPHVLINNEISCMRTIRNCITQNTLRTILDMAKLNHPVPLQIMYVNKTEKMRVVDQVLREKCETVMKVREDTCWEKGIELHLPVVKELYYPARTIAECEELLGNIRRDIAFHDSSYLETLHEKLYQQIWGTSKLLQGVKRMQYPGPKDKLVPGFVQHILDHVESSVQNVKEVKEKGGKGWDHWSVRFRRKKFCSSSYQVKIYIERRKVYAAQIKEWKDEAREIKHKLQSLQGELEAFLNKLRAQGEHKFIRNILDDVKQTVYLIYCTDRPSIDFQDLDAMIGEDIYVRGIADSAINLEKFYLKKWTLPDGYERNPDCAVQEEMTDAPDATPRSYCKDTEDSLDNINRVLATDAKEE
ncbi:hypothetical protein BG005_000333 [Podila minutissima]|nr:hypothetical protein BG005_000333 [Podila minutissima]